ncbi:MAG: ACP phosphodiesterase [Bacteroidota bacterium]|nr:ACP phosphodiesterase [Bacteroidota bacterium]
MNYLAHIYLSGTDSEVQIGNFIGDFVKGSQLNAYPENIRRGIVLHRKIDSFTDSHPVVRETIALLRPTFGRYSGILVDMYFDYFLANNFSDYLRQKSLDKFAFHFYFVALVNYRYLPERVKGFIFHFIFTNRLSKYSKLAGLKDSLEIMANHKVPAIHPEETITFLIQNRDELEKLFHQFFPDLVVYVQKELI